MANVQLKRGYTRIANHLLEALCRERLPAAHLRTALALVRLTYGYNRKAAQISRRQLLQLTRTDERTARRILEDLVAWRVVRRLPGPPRTAPHLAIEKDYDRWEIGPSAAARRRRVDRAAGGRAPRRASAPGRAPRSLLLKDKGKDTAQKTPAEAAGGVSPVASLEERIEEIWPQVLEAVAQYRSARWGRLTPRRLARCREVVASYPERGARVLVEIVHGYAALHRKHGKGFDPAARMTPAVLYGPRCDDYLDEYDARRAVAAPAAPEPVSREDQALELRRALQQRIGREPNLEELRELLAAHGLEDLVEEIRGPTPREREAFDVLRKLRRSRRRFPSLEEKRAALLEAGLEDVIDQVLGEPARMVSATATRAPAGGVRKRSHG